uniref:WRKY transcription factor 70 n=1 Tax=Cajanus cajan TaxID=3821 RepID=A0A151U066_CAJCA|nr:putative WRKY transcription factor 70 [Cajanus cajan]
MISEKERVIMEELVKGQEAATQLKGLLENPIGSEDSLSLSPEELLENVLSSFSQAISIINVSSFQPPPPPPAPHVLGSTSYSMSEDCSVNWNRSEQGQSDERDSHSIRKGKGAPTRTEFSNTTDDGYVWRKYGEKPFPNSKFIRCYHLTSGSRIVLVSAPRWAPKCSCLETLLLLFLLLDLLSLRCRPDTVFKGWGGYLQRHSDAQLNTHSVCSSVEGVFGMFIDRRGIRPSPWTEGSYFRCTYGYGHDQRCMATKQVQQCEENPDMYEITYIGNHTCNANLPTRNDERLHEGSDHEMQNRENDSLYSQFRGKQKIIDSESSWSLLTSSSDRNTDTTLSNSHDYSGPS